MRIFVNALRRLMNLLTAGRLESPTQSLAIPVSTLESKTLASLGFFYVSL
jgi:hypothetical protein